MEEVFGVLALFFVLAGERVIILRNDVVAGLVAICMVMEYTIRSNKCEVVGQCLFVAFFAGFAAMVVVTAKRKYFFFKFGVPLGALLNCLVMAVNGYSMPVSESALRQIGVYDSNLSGWHHTVTASTRFPYLADMFYGPHSIGISSIGDNLLFVCSILTAIQLIAEKRRGRKLPSH